MSRRSMRRLVPLGALALVAGAAGAHAADDGGSDQPQPAARVASATPAAHAPAGPRARALRARARARARARPRTAPAAASARALRARARAARAPIFPAAPPAIAILPTARSGRPLQLEPCRPRGGARAAPSEALKNAFGILRRERRDDDALPARALRALKARGLLPVDPQSARLLRSDGDARAWVVPVPDVDAGSPFGCVRGRAPREGLAVVSLGGAPAGGGGGLRDLQRGLAPAATVEPCSGPGRNMLSVSGIVPDGVGAVFVTAVDGTATRADVHENGFVFVLPATRRPEPRYLVWTGADGTPHVQPLPFVFVRPRGTDCGQSDKLPRVTPGPWGATCGPLGLPPAISVSPRRPLRPKRAPRIPSRRRPPARPAPIQPPAGPVQAPPAVLFGACAPGVPTWAVSPSPPAAVPVPRPAQRPTPVPARPPARPAP